MSRVLGDKAGRQPVEKGVIPHQPHGGGADDKQWPVLRVACSNADGLHACLWVIHGPHATVVCTVIAQDIVIVDVMMKWKSKKWAFAVLLLHFIQ